VRAVTQEMSSLTASVSATALPGAWGVGRWALGVGAAGRGRWALGQQRERPNAPALVIRKRETPTGRSRRRDRIVCVLLLGYKTHS